MEHETLKKLGFDPSLLNKTDSSIPDACVPARVTQVQKDSYFVTKGIREVYAEITGKLLFSADSPLDLPVTGDWCMVQFVDGDKLAIIHRLLPRKTLLKRKKPGRQKAFQPLASNIDTAMVVQALADDFNLRRLERYLVMIRDGGIEPVVLLSKLDLISTREAEDKITAVKETVEEVKVIPFSNTDGTGLETIAGILKPGRTYCLLGSSGVGKSTLLNRLSGREMKTSEIREKDGKGRHTTTARQLLFLASGAMVVDTPGLRELGNIGAGEGLGAVFDEIQEFEDLCRFSDCTHQNEDGCAILLAVENGDVSEERFENYRKMRREFEFNERSFLEKRRRDKEFGKLYKSVQKHNKKR